MSGHSKWSTIKRKKGAQDAKRGKIFTRLAREISLAARESGGDLDANFRLRLAVDRARAENMPKENIERAIKRGTGEDKSGSELEELTYEGYGPHGVALMIFVATDNRNRTIADVRHVLNRFGGSMGENGSVSWQFNRMAHFTFPAEGHDPDVIFELAVEAGADDVQFEDENIEILGPVEFFKTIGDALRAANIEVEDAGLKYIPTNELELDVEATLQVMRCIEVLEDLDDVQEVFSNLSVSDEALARLEA